MPVGERSPEHCLFGHLGSLPHGSPLGQHGGGLKFPPSSAGEACLGSCKTKAGSHTEVSKQPPCILAGEQLQLCVVCSPLFSAHPGTRWQLYGN